MVFRVMMVLRKHGIPYNIIDLNVVKGDQFKPEFLKVCTEDRFDRNYNDCASGAFLDKSATLHPNNGRQWIPSMGKVIVGPRKLGLAIGP